MLGSGNLIMADRKTLPPTGGRELELDASAPDIELETPSPDEERPAFRPVGVVAARAAESKWAAEPPPVVPTARFVRKPTEPRTSPVTASIVAVLLLAALAFGAHAAWRAWTSAAQTAATPAPEGSPARRPPAVDRVARQLLADGIAAEIAADESDPENATRATADLAQKLLLVRSARCSQPFADSLVARFAKELNDAGLARVTCTDRYGAVYSSGVAQ